MGCLCWVLSSVCPLGPDDGLEPISMGWDVTCADQEGEYYLAYFGWRRPAPREVKLPEDRQFRIEILDAWNMTITEVPGVFSGKCRVDLPGKQYIGLHTAC
jgi:hypothetical protein